MSEQLRSFFGCGLDDDRTFDLNDYGDSIPRWCVGCGDHGVLSAVKRMMRDQRLLPERTVFVSGIGCSSRFPHYLDTYGFHGIHGRALPIATGVKLSRPDLDVFVVTGDGDCCSIGAGHWLHATRYNIDMTVLLLDNAIYGLTKNQTSPTTPEGFETNTQPHGTYLPALNPLSTALGVTNASFVAQTADWVPAHLLATLKAAYEHVGFSFVRILQRCPKFSAPVFSEQARTPDLHELLFHSDGITVPSLDKIYKHRLEHDPSDLDRARSLAEDTERTRLGIFFKDATRPCYNAIRHLPTYTAAQNIERLNRELDRYAV
ncbi:MAG: 2-oxoglutarate oxidoreductase [Deltaproteobacteria bacterium]|nr:2-oxoglutarate oxidoreductase [Deltaproteobacteria bacterium]MBW2361247.1 2-oxoglutarate oxidoreductase [Deltaproteobacteria bacterium]